MNCSRRNAALSILALTFSLCVSGRSVTAQEMYQRGAIVPSTSLTLSYQGKSITLTPADLAAAPHTTVTVFNARTKASETYSGVPLATLLAKLGVPQGEAVRGPLFMTGIIAEGTDGYRVLYSLAEVDPTIHVGQVLVADTLDGKPIIVDGAFKLVSPEEKRPARWVRNLNKVSVITVNP